MKALTMVFVGVALLAIGVPCARADWTVAGFVGAAHTQNSSIRLIQPRESTDITISPVAYRAESFASPIYYGYRVGFFPRSRWLGLEGEFIHLKVIAETSRTAEFTGTLEGQHVSATQPIATVVERFSITHGVNLVLVNAVARHPLRNDGAWRRWLITGRLGVGASVPHPESTIAGMDLEHYEWGSFSAQAAAGVELRLAPRISLAAEYKLTRTVQEVSVVHGSVSTPLTTHHLATGVAVHLGALQQ